MKESTVIVVKPVQHAFLLGNWAVDLELNYIWEIGEPETRVSLEPRLMHLLCFLSANSGHVLTRNQLTEELWPTVIVNENSLTRAISELRKKLETGKNSNNGYLETIPKKGYRLKPALIRPLVTEQKANLIKKTKRSNCYSIKLTRFWQPALTAASLMVAMALTFGQFTMSADRPAEYSDNTMIADQVIGSEENFGGAQISLSKTFSQTSGYSPFVDQIPAIAPPLVSNDGKTLVYIRYENNLSTIYLSSVESIQTPLAVFSSEQKLFNLSWSPLGDALLFASQPVAITTTLMDQTEQTADLLMLNLETLEIKVLIDTVPERQENNHSRDIELT